MQQEYMTKFRPALSIPLTKLIGYAVCNEVGFRELIEKTKNAIYGYSTIDVQFPRMNETYIKDKLDDLIWGQFSEKEKFMVELVTNALDSKTDRIFINHDGSMIKVDDFGTGMSIETLMRDLSLPFYTNKDGKTTIGRYGIGFYSSLVYLYSDGFVCVDTKQDGMGYRVLYNMTNDTIHATFSESVRTERGTSVQLAFGNSDKKLEASETKDYLIDNAGYIFPKRCRISFNDEEINRITRTKSKTRRSYEIPFGQEKIYASLDCGNKKGGFTFLQTVKVKRDSSPFEVYVDFPLSLDLVESRDNFIESEKFKEAKHLVFRDAFLRYYGEFSSTSLLESKHYGDERNLLRRLEKALDFTGFVREFLTRASKKELLEFFKLLNPETKDRDIILDHYDKSHLFFSDDANCLRSSLNDLYRNFWLFGSNNNPNILSESDFVKTKIKDRKEFWDLTKEETERYHLKTLGKSNIEEVVFLDLSENSILPYMNAFEEKTSYRNQLWVNLNHPIFKIPRSEMTFEQRAALDWFSSSRAII